MSSNKPKPPPQPAPEGAGLDALIGQVYDVALDPMRYEAMLDTWERAAAALRQTAPDLAPLENGSLASHIARADAMLDALRPSDAGKGAEYASLLAPFGSSAAFVLGPGARLLTANPAARASLAARPGAPLSALALEPDDAAALEEQSRRLIARPASGTAMLRIRAADGRLIVLQMRGLSRPDGSAIIVAACSELHLPEGFAAILRRIFDLTEAEAEIALHLLECANLQEIARQRGRSVETIRGQLRTIFAKTETRSQVELIRLVMSLLSVGADAAPPASGPDSGADPLSFSGGTGRLERLTYHSVRRENGRRVDYLVLGDPAGAPVLFLPMGYGFQRWPASAEAHCARHGLRIVVPVMPGFGRSDPVPMSADFGAEVARDFALILDDQGIARLPAITIYGAHGFASELERLRPGTLTALIATAGLLPFETREQLERMAKWPRFMHRAAKITPRLLPFVVKTGFRLTREAGAHGFLSSVYRSSASDLAAINDPEILETFEATLVSVASEHHSAHRGFAQHASFIYATDQASLLKWISARLPVVFVNGLDDVSVPPETLAELRPNYPDIRFHIIEKAGQLLFFRHWRRVLALLDETLREGPPG